VSTQIIVVTMLTCACAILSLGICLAVVLRYAVHTAEQFSSGVPAEVCCLLARLITAADLNACRDHVRQLQRMYQLRELVPLQLLLIENFTHMAGRYQVYQPGPNPTTGACTVDSETSLFDFIVRAAVSPYGSTQRVLLTPTEGDSRAVLLAMTQLLLHEMQQLQLDQQRQAAGLQQQHKLLAASQTSYPEFVSLCQQVNQRLPRSQLPFELASYARVSPVSPDVAFSVTKGAGKSEFAGLVLHSHRSYPQLQIVSIEGHTLLKLLNGFHADAVAAHKGAADKAAAVSGGTSAGLAVSEAVEAAQEVATLLTSLLEGFVADAGVSTGSSSQLDSTQQQQQRQPCRMLMVRDLLGAVTYMAKVQQQAAINTGSKAATKKAAERQAEACAFDAGAIKQCMWLWLLCFLQHGWHLQLCQSARATEILLEVAGSRGCWLAEELQGSGQQQQQPPPVGEQRQGSEPSGAGAQAGNKAQQQPQQQQSKTPSSSSFMDWLVEMAHEKCAAEKQQEHMQQSPTASGAGQVAAAAAAAAAARPAGTGAAAGGLSAQRSHVAAEVIVLETQPDDDVIVVD
jgi:hypothetical protein